MNDDAISSTGLAGSSSGESARMSSSDSSVESSCDGSSAERVRSSTKTRNENLPTAHHLTSAVFYRTWVAFVRPASNDIMASRDAKGKTGVDGF